MRVVLPGCFVILSLLLGACAAPTNRPVATRAVASDMALPPMRRFGNTVVAPPARPNAEMMQDFLDLAFQLESGRSLPVLTRFEGAINVRMTGPVPPSAQADLTRVLGRLRAEAGIPIRQAQGEAAAITIEFLPRRTMQRLVPRAACFVAPRVRSWAEYRRAGRNALDWTTLEARRQSAIFIPNDTAPQEIRDCLHEELAQALGPLNDLYRLPDSVFNDDNVHTILTGFDMLMLRVYYAPELANGMRRGEVAARLPRIFARLNPRGEGRSGRIADPAPPAFGRAIETALGPGTSPGRRRSAIREALAIAQSRSWTDARAGFVWLALGRLSLGHDAEEARDAFLQASAIYHNAPGLALQAAHADMQLAAFALSNGQPDIAIGLVDRSTRVVAAAENAALLANLLMVKAEALDLLGRHTEARIVRLDSLGWARYGFASDAEVEERLLNVASLSPVQTKRRP
ncbi:DUF2927 domain-containing protein [Defluviimonas sp. WL0050]|uniref:DUF2927 domain-containing protein n=1 Tax=Albidovulum litorale TaxID=2984134 RepID=A0ABT2ZPT8_9RHOB|nr:DUF2927 domain-containing protein [Defluviimonas sp. WL0050]MCV2873113.1 DUF2927 domain-containing protein [Defluviimonas sp. WL0050]